MKLFYLILTSFALSFMQSADKQFDQAESALKRNNAAQVVSLGGDKILLNIEGKDGVYSKPQVALMLKNFFSKHPCRSFSYSHKGQQGKSTAVGIGEYKSDRQFRVTVQFKASGSSYRLERLSIE